VSQIESGVRSGYQAFAGTSDGTGSADAISVTPGSSHQMDGDRVPFSVRLRSYSTTANTARREPETQRPSNSGSPERTVLSAQKGGVTSRPRGRGAEASARSHVTTPNGAVVDDHRRRLRSARPMGLRRERSHRIDSRRRAHGQTQARVVSSPRRRQRPPTCPCFPLPCP
jgi:hypothetical protein